MSALEIGISWGFWACAGSIGYAYAGYPVVIYGLSRLFGRTDEPAALRVEDLPRVSLLIVAHNEEAVIEARLQNALATDYPKEKLEIAVASDGSSDWTPAIVRRYARRGVRLYHDPQRRGKAATLNRMIPQLDGDVVVLSDANTEVDPAAVRSLARWFADANVGAVCGRLVLTDCRSGRNADGRYWRYETFLKRCEGRLGALLGANGAIYAIRRSRFVPIPDRTIVDDFVIPLLAKVRHGCTLAYDADAVAREETAPDVRSEFHRRARIGAGGFQAIGILRPLLDVRRGWVSLAFWSHKVLRWCCPLFMLGALACSAMLVARPLYRAALVGQVAWYSISLLPASIRLPRALRVVQMFTNMNAALLVGCWRWWNEAQPAAWEPTQRAERNVRRAA